MTALDFTDDFDSFDGFGGLDAWDDDDGLDGMDDEGDAWWPAALAAAGLTARKALGTAVGGAVGNAAGGAIYDQGTGWLNRGEAGSYRKRIGGAVTKDWVRDVLTGAGSALGGGIGFAISEDDPYEPEYMLSEVDGMAALLEEALEADGEDAAMAVDEMVARGFGVMRAAPQIRRIIAALAQKVKALVARARQDPRLKAIARAAPIALRRTAVQVVRMVTSGRPVTAAVALKLFAANLQALVRSPQHRQAAARSTVARARRCRGMAARAPARRSA